jgi:hypothetical protein
MTNFKEGDHPRDKEDKFSKNDDLIIVSENELGNYESIEELRERAVEYYKNNLQGIFVDNKDIGNIRFSKKGRDEFFYYSAEEDKIKLIPYIKKIIEKSRLKEYRELKHIRKDGIVGFYYLDIDVVQNNRKKNIETIIGKDKTGNLFYDLFVDNPKEKRARRTGSGNINPDMSTGSVPTIK